MSIIFEQRHSDSPYVERIWRSRSEGDTHFYSLAFNHCQLVVWEKDGIPQLTIRGPESVATEAHIGPDREHFAITFKYGTFMTHFPASDLVDNALTLPAISKQAFWLNSAAWEIPTFENADTFVQRLVREGLLVHEPVVDAVKHNQPQQMSLRTVQRRYLYATGLTHGAASQIERARQAIVLLRNGTSILDTVEQTGYADQPHLTRSLKHFTGQTPAQILQHGTSQQVSFLFKTDSPD
jgi:AraC-like DNA-binding protein